MNLAKRLTSPLLMLPLCACSSSGIALDGTWLLDLTQTTYAISGASVAAQLKDTDWYGYRVEYLYLDIRSCWPCKGALSDYSLSVYMGYKNCGTDEPPYEWMVEESELFRFPGETDDSHLLSMSSVSLSSEEPLRAELRTTITDGFSNYGVIWDCGTVTDPFRGDQHLRCDPVYPIGDESREDPPSAILVEYPGPPREPSCEELETMSSHPDYRDARRVSPG